MPPCPLPLPSDFGCRRLVAEVSTHQRGHPVLLRSGSVAWVRVHRHRPASRVAVAPSRGV